MRNGPRQTGVGVYLFHGQFLSKWRTCQALSDLFGAPVAASTRGVLGETGGCPDQDEGADDEYYSIREAA